MEADKISETPKRKLSRVYFEEDVSWITIFFSAFSILTYIGDIGSDIFTTFLLFQSREYLWCSFSFTLTLVPVFIVNIYSLLWFNRREVIVNHNFSDIDSGSTTGIHIMPKSITVKYLQNLSHVFLCGIVSRHVDIIHHGICYKKAISESPSSRDENPAYSVIDKYLKEFAYKRKEAANLQLIECFLQDVPQFTLQIYIWASRKRRKGIVQDCNELCITQLLSIAFSLISFSSAIVNFQQCSHSLKRGESKLKISFVTSLIQFTWRLGTTGARIFAIVLALLVYPFALIAVLIFHWILMITWFRFWTKNSTQISKVNKPDNDEEIDMKTKIINGGYNCLMGAVYIFCYLNLTDIHSAMSLAKYYCLTSLEDIGFLMLWYFKSCQPGQECENDEDNLEKRYWQFTSVVFVYSNAFFVGISAMIIYYRFLRKANINVAKEINENP